MDIAQLRATARKECGVPPNSPRIRLLVGALRGNHSGEKLCTNLREEIERRGAAIDVTRTGSFGCSGLEPIVVVDTPGRSTVACFNANPEMATDLDADAFAAGLAKRGGDWYQVRGQLREDVPLLSTRPLFSLQQRVALRNCGWIDPDDIHDYILHANGLAGLFRAVQKGRPECFSRLCVSYYEDHVGTGSSSLDQWKECLESGKPDTCLVCNAVAVGEEAGPGSLLLRSDPFSILEGLLIGAYVVGATSCLVYLAAKGGLAPKLRDCLQALSRYNLVGPGILGSSFGAHFEIQEVPETVLDGHLWESFRCIGHKQAVPPILPAYSIFKGLSGKPAIIMDPESAAFLTSVFLADEELEAGFGADKNRPSGILALSGSIRNAVTAEIPCGVSLRSVIEDIGGGVSGGRRLKAVLIGSPIGELLGPDDLDACAHCRISGKTGSGGRVAEIIDCDVDIVALAGERMAYVSRHSCGKCLFCCEGSRQLLHALKKIAAGDGKLRDLELLKDIGEGMQSGCSCALGRKASDLLLSSIKLFPEEYEEQLSSGGVVRS